MPWNTTNSKTSNSGTRSTETYENPANLALKTRRLINQRKWPYRTSETQFHRIRTSNYEYLVPPSSTRFGEPNFEVSGRRHFALRFLIQNDPFGTVSGPGKPGAHLGRFGTPPGTVPRDDPIRRPTRPSRWCRDDDDDDHDDDHDDDDDDDDHDDHDDDDDHDHDDDDDQDDDDDDLDHDDDDDDDDDSDHDDDDDVEQSIRSIDQSQIAFSPQPQRESDFEDQLANKRNRNERDTKWPSEWAMTRWAKEIERASERKESLLKKKKTERQSNLWTSRTTKI